MAVFRVERNNTLNVGRVQTPTLKMLVDRGEAISHFKKEKYYHVRLDLSGAEAASERISDKSRADALKAACEAGTAVCVSLTKEKKTAAPPKLFDLTSLQREANTPTADELEAKVRNGEQISLAEYAAALKAEKEQGKETKPGKKTEKKPSIRAQLKADKERAAQRKQARSKSQDLERS